MVFGTGIAMMVQAGLGLGPWEALNQGIARQTGLAIGTVSILLGIPILALWWPLGVTTWFYPLVAAVLGGFWLKEAHGLHARAKAGVTGAKLKEMRLFHWSITYVSLVFLAVAIDPFVS